MRLVEAARILGLGLSLVAGAACQNTPPLAASDGGPDDLERWKLAVLRARTRSEITSLTGSVPECSPLDASRERCVWQVQPRDVQRTRVGEFGEIEMESAQSEHVRVACALPLDGSPRAKDSCTTELVPLR